MKKILTIIVLALLISCTDDIANQPFSKTEYHQDFFENSQLIISPVEKPERLSLDVVDGNKLVFKFLRYEDIYPQWIDDEQITIVYFEVDPSVTEFKIEKDDFKEANAIIGVGASVRILQRISEGSISGTKISDNEWEVNLNVAFNYEEIIQDVTLSTNFNKGVYEGVWMPIFTY